MAIPLTELAARLKARVEGPQTLLLEDVASLEQATPQCISFGESRRQLAAIRKTHAGALLVNEELAALLEGCGKTLLIVEKPHAAFVEAMLSFRPPHPRAEVGYSKLAVIHPSVEFGSDCNVMPYAVIGKNVVIGDRCDIGPGVVIQDNCRIGNDCVIHANTVLYSNVTLEDRVIVHANAVLGADGFGYRFEQGALKKIPHTGGVVLEHDVEIGACATVDRGMVSDTVIGTGTKLDNQVMIAHNCRIGRHNAFASQVGLAGSVTTGDYVQMGGQVGVADHIQIGSGIKFGGKAGVVDNLSEPGVYHGIPAIPEKEAIRNHLSVKRLSELRNQVKHLTQQLAELQLQLSEASSTVPRPRSAA